jgi:hypothetical protein
VAFAFTTGSNQVNLSSWGTGSYTVELNVTTAGTNVLGYKAQLLRVNSACGVVSTLATSAATNGTGLKTFSFTNITSSGSVSDRLQVRVLASAGHSAGGSSPRTLSIRVNDANAEVHVPWVPATPPPTPTPSPSPTPTATPVATATPTVGTPTSTATPNPDGFKGHSFSGATAPTGQKPQSKLWFNDGIWWSSMFNPSAGDFHIYRLNWSTQTWIDTGVLIDTRISSSADTLWDGTKLYIVSAGDNPGTSEHAAQLRRFSYNTSTETYTLDSGYPVTIVSGGMEAIVLAKATNGVLWVTYTRDNAVWVARSTTIDSTWGSPFNLPVANASNLSVDDLSSIVAFDSKIGVMWGNQNTQTYYFATHADSAGDLTWQSGPALAISNGADDHINLKAMSGDSSGRVFAPIKTSRTAAADPLIMLLVLEPDGSWANYTVTTAGENQTRPIVQIDEQNRRVYVFASGPCCSGDVIYYKHASLDGISFPSGSGISFMDSASDNCINNVSSTKQNLNNATDLVAIAGADCTDFYFHNKIDLP